MQIDAKSPPRRFIVKGRLLSHVADIALEPDELVTFVAGDTQYDVARKEWGYYATPSLNRRLPDHGLRPVLVRAPEGTAYVLLVTNGREASFQAYLAEEGHRILGWLDEEATLTELDGRTEADASGREDCLLCGHANHDHMASFTDRPTGETDFGLFPYRRSLWRCRGCGHVVNRHAMDLSALYRGDYWERTYGTSVRATFDRIMALPPERSDNRGRVARILEYWNNSGATAPRTLLDVGSGLAVFPAAMREAGWECAALDPDPAAGRHAQSVAGVEPVTEDFLALPPNRRFGLITLNKVLEHVPGPMMIDMLVQAGRLLEPGGVIYVELPDGEAALRDSPEREEFFIEHLCAFSAASFSLLIARAGLALDRLERVREPSGKYTLRAFAAPA